MMKILVAADGSERTWRIVDYLATHEGLFGAKREVHVLHVVDPLPHPAAAHATMAAVRRLYEEDGDSAVREITTLFERRGVTARSRWEFGRPAETIAKVADGNYDLLVLGSHGRAPLANVVLGSVATEVLARSRTPVLVIP